jgi:hypothetical protein
LFFVPRKIWPNKPILGGLVVGEDLYENYGAGTPNLSFFFGGDLYLDFSWAGPIIGFLLLGGLWRFTYRRALSVDGLNVIHLVTIGSIPILMRGPLGAVIGYYFCLLVASILLYILGDSRRFFDKSENRRQKIVD